MAPFGEFTTSLPLGQTVIDQFLGLNPHPTKCQATYIWIDGTGEHIRSKTRTLETAPTTVKGESLNVIF